MAKVEFDPKTVTLADIGEIYQKAKGIKSKPALGLDSLFKAHANRPVLELFDNTDGESVVRTIIRTAAESGEEGEEKSIKGVMQALRNVNVFLRRELGKEAPDYLLKTEDAKKGAVELFGFEEPAKAKAQLGIDTKPRRLQPFVDGLMDFAERNPDQLPVVRAILFGMNTGLRPGAYVITDKNSGLRPNFYLGEDGALFIPAEATGAKGRKISVPLSAMADKMIQEQLAQNGPNAEFIFSFEDGKPVKSSDVNKVLAQIKVPELIFDASTGKYYDNLMLDKDAKTKKGVQILRNLHTTLGLKAGVDPVVLAKLQGRSGKSSAKGPTGEMFTYESNYPGDVSEFERSQANVFAGTYGEAIRKSELRIQEKNSSFKFDIGNVDTDANTERVTKNTQGFENYFDQPEVESVETPQVDIVQKAEFGTDEAKTDFTKLADIFKKGGLFGFVGAGTYGVFEAGRLAYDKAREEGASMAMAGAAGVGTALYEVAEPVPLAFMRPQPVGEGSELIPDYESRVEEQMSRIRQYDERDDAIDDQMSRIRQYEKREDEEEPGVEVEIFTRDDPRFLTGE
ncbi:MAG: hypothetical protein ACPHEP_07010 [Acidimicrobiales bacterium]